MTTVRIGVVEMGSAGSMHARVLSEGKVAGATLAAVVCRPGRVAASAYLPRHVRHFDTLNDLLAGSPACCDAVIIATPHRLHPDLAIHKAASPAKMAANESGTVLNLEESF